MSEIIALQQPGSVRGGPTDLLSKIQDAAYLGRLNVTRPSTGEQPRYHSEFITVCLQDE